MDEQETPKNLDFEVMWLDLKLNLSGAAPKCNIRSSNALEAVVEYMSKMEQDEKYTLVPL